MGLTMNERKAVTNELAKRYQRASKKDRGRLLKEFIELTGYARCYASHVLHNWGRRHIRIVNGERVEVVIGVKRTTPTKRKKPRRYDAQTITILEKLWAIADGLCGKRLRAFIHTTLPILERCGELSIPDDTVRTNLLTISPATIDRLLAPTRTRAWDRGRSRTKPGTLLKHHIPIRTFSDWNENIPGFLEIDLVAHDGGSAYGDFLQTLDATDIATGWTETRAVRTKAQVWVLNALHLIRRDLPFPILGLDSDNGGEFINNHLVRFCEACKISFTRGRPYRKNDSCYVEQKNYSIVRKTTGYYRYDTEEQLTLLDELYRQLRLYTNYFQPVMKLVSKTRIGSKVQKRYDDPQTPFERLLAHAAISVEIKDRLSEQFASLNPAALKRSLAQLQHRLFLSKSPPPQIPRYHPLPSPSHPWHRTGNLRNPFIPKKPLDSNQENHHPPQLPP